MVTWKDSLTRLAKAADGSLGRQKDGSISGSHNVLEVSMTNKQAWRFSSPAASSNHRYLMSRLSLQVFYLWRHVLSTAAPFTVHCIMVVKFRNTICPPPPQISLHRRAALSSNSNGTRCVYSRKNPKRSVHCEMSMAPTKIAKLCTVT
jgi:hypothetical protein